MDLKKRCEIRTRYLYAQLSMCKFRTLLACFAGKNQGDRYCHWRDRRAHYRVPVRVVARALERLGSGGSQWRTKGGLIVMSTRVRACQWRRVGQTTSTLVARGADDMRLERTIT